MLNLPSSSMWIRVKVYTPGINLIRGEIQSWSGGKERTRRDQNLLGGIAVLWGYSEIFAPPPKRIMWGQLRIIQGEI